MGLGEEGWTGRSFVGTGGTAGLRESGNIPIPRIIHPSCARDHPKSQNPRSQNPKSPKSHPVPFPTPQTLILGTKISHFINPFPQNPTRVTPGAARRDRGDPWGPLGTLEALSPCRRCHSLSRQGSHTVWLTPQGCTTPSPTLQARQHSPLAVKSLEKHSGSLEPPAGPCGGQQSQRVTGVTPPGHL